MTYQISTPVIEVALWTHVWVRMKNVKCFVVIKNPTSWLESSIAKWKSMISWRLHCSKLQQNLSIWFLWKINWIASLKYQQKQKWKCRDKILVSRHQDKQNKPLIMGFCNIKVHDDCRAELISYCVSFVLVRDFSIDG